MLVRLVVKVGTGRSKGIGAGGALQVHEMCEYVREMN